jgi:hypothetical protein
VKGILIRPGADTAVEVDIDARGALDDLRALQGLVGGYVDFIPLAHGAVAHVNEDGHPLDLPPNPLGTAVAIELGWKGAMLVGPVVLLGARDGKDTDVPQRVRDVLGNRLRREETAP